MKNKFYLGKLQERNGEYEYTHNIPFETDGATDPDKWLADYAAEFYDLNGGGAEAQDGGYYFHCGCVFVSVESVQEILLCEYAVLKKLGV